MKGKNRWKRFLSWLLVFVMVLGSMPITVFADTNSYTVTTINLNSVGKTENVEVNSASEKVKVVFTAPSDGAYIMYYQVDRNSNWDFKVNLKASCSNATEYRVSKDQYSGHLLEMKAGETYTMIFVGNDLAYKVKVGVTTPVSNDQTLNLQSFTVAPGTQNLTSIQGDTIETDLEKGTLNLAFFINNYFAYDKKTTWTASSSNANVISFNNVFGSLDPKEPNSPADYAKYIGYAPIFELHEAGNATISIAANYKGKTITKEFHVTVNGKSGSTTEKLEFSNISQLKDLLDTYSDSNAEVRVHYNGNSDFSVTESLTVPEHVELSFDDECNIIIVNGKKLSVEGNMFCGGLNVQGELYISATGNVNPCGNVSVNGTMTNYGELLCGSNIVISGLIANHGTIEILKTATQTQIPANGVISTGPNGTFTNTSNAVVKIETDPTITDIKTVLPKMNLECYDVVVENFSSSSKYWNLNYVGNLPAHATPSNVQWGVAYSRDESTGNVVIATKPGAMSWETAFQGQAHVLVKLYNKENGEEVAAWQTNFYSPDQLQYHTDDWFMIYEDQVQSGVYYFTVQLLGDGENYRNSGVAVSPEYTYVKPQLQLEACENPTWEKRYDGYVNWMVWDTDAVSEITSKYKDGYQVELYYSKTADGQYTRANSAWDRKTMKPERPFSSRFMDRTGAGYYKYRVRKISNNIAECQNGKWSGYSEALQVKDVPKDLTSDLNSILNSTEGNDYNTIRNAFDNVKTMELLATLVTDTENSGATTILADIEAKVGGSASVDVKLTEGAFDASKISIIGANLNTKVSEGEDKVKLVLDSPSGNFQFPADYKKDTAIQFSMTVTEVANPAELKVPVKITLPVPDSIDPMKLVILHDDHNGAFKQEWPYVYEKDGKIYADFVLNGFSDFILTEELSSDRPSGGDDKIIKFKTLQDIVNEIGNGDTSNRILVYDGNADFEFDKSITIPSYIGLQFDNYNVSVDAGITLTTNSWIACRDLDVNGTYIAKGKVEVKNDLTVSGTMTNDWDVDAKNLYVYSTGIMTSNGMPKISDSAAIAGMMTINNGMWVEKALNVTGTLNIPQYNVTMGASYTVYGLDKINSVNKIKISVERSFNTIAKLEQLLNDAKNETRPEISFFYWIAYVNGPSLTIDRNLEVPANVLLQLGNIESMVVDAGKKLTNYGRMEVHLTMNVRGELENNGEILVQNLEEIEVRPELNGILTIENTGTYTENGNLYVHTELSVPSLNNIMNGFDLSKFGSNAQSDLINWWYTGGNIGGNNDSTMVVFDDISDIEAEIAKNDPNDRILVYNGTSPFTFTKDIVIPNNLALQFEQQDVTVATGVTITTNNWIACDDLTVEGTFIANRQVEAKGTVTVNGTMTTSRDLYAGNNLVIAQDDPNNSNDSAGQLIVQNGGVYINYPGTVSGFDNIQFVQDWSSLYFDAGFENMTQLKDQVAALTSDKTYANNKRVVYLLSIKGDRSQSAPDFEITEDITIPSHVEFQLQGNRKYILKENKNLTIKGQLFVAAPFVVNGTLTNENMVQVSNMPTKPNDWLNGTVTIGTKGSYIGSKKAILQVESDSAIQNWNTILTGFEQDDYDIQSDVYSDGSNIWKLRYVKGLTKLGTPTNLTWGTEYREAGWNIDPVTGTLLGVHLTKHSKPGVMSWKAVLPDQAWVEIKIYRVGTNGQVVNCREWFDPMVQPEYRSSYGFNLNDLPSGDYYFTVQSMADNIDYRNSDVARSGVYHYVKPNDKLDIPVNLRWDDRNDMFVSWADWAAGSNSSYIGGYNVEYYYSATEHGQYQQISGSEGINQPTTERPLDDWIVQEGGIGYYKYKVRALSNNIEKIGNSEWSAFSPALNMVKIPQDVKNDLDIIMNKTNTQTMTPADVRTEVQKMDTEDLKKTLLTDQDNTGATQVLKDLEAKAGGPAPVSVSNSTFVSNANDISVVGANLNNQAGSAGPITLEVGEPRTDHVIPDRFNSAVSVKFSMTLANVANPTNLAVPVKITLPIPTSINPDYLVIIHYHLTGEPELIWPHIYEKNGKMYADFVVTGFSDFAMTEVYPEDVSDDSDNNMSSQPDYNDDREDTVSVKKPVQSENAPVPDYVVTGQWTMENGKWKFADQNGETFKNRWAAVVNPYADTKKGQDAFDWFFFDENGHMITGWYFDGGKWYYLNPASDGTMGRMFTGWQLINDTWYYLNPVSDGTRGSMKTDWQLIDNKWYYFDPKSGATQGAMLKDTWIDGYYVDSNGVWDASKTN